MRRVECQQGADVEVILQVGTDAGGVVDDSDAMPAQFVGGTDADSIRSAANSIAPPHRITSRAALARAGLPWQM